MAAFCPVLFFLGIFVNIVLALNQCASSTDICKQEANGLNVIIGAPHGGKLRPGDIPDRDHGCYNAATRKCSWRPNCGRKDPVKCKASLLSDMYTIDIAVQLSERLCQLMNRCPALVLNQLHRKKMDPNRSFEDATQGSSHAVRAFFDYHGFINMTTSKFCGPSLFLDIHGHTHTKQRTELGYLVYSSRLRSGDFGPEDTSINNLVFRNRGRVSFDDLLRGQMSLGGFLNREGLRATPSPSERSPASGDSYFSGGYSTQLHGSLSEGTMDAIQIEASRDQRSNEGRPAFVEALAKAVQRFIIANKYYD